MIVGICGLGYTGSGAVIDLLKEYNGPQVEDKDEFGLVFRPDGLQDLYYQVMHPRRYMSCDMAIHRFIRLFRHTFRPRAGWGGDYSRQAEEYLRQFIDEITQVTWKGAWSGDAYMKPSLINSIDGHFFMRISRIANRKFNKLIYPNREMFLSVRPENYMKCAVTLVSQLFGMLGYDDSGTLILNQPFAGNDPASCFDYFRDARAIVVDKDPRDLYFQCKYEVRSNCTWTPCYDVKKVVDYYRALRNGMERESTEKILFVRFEDLIYEYNKTVEMIENFIGLSPESHISPKKFLNPDISINNTQLFRKYSSFQSETDYIEKHLPEYLYPYENYEVKTQFGASYND